MGKVDSRFNIIRKKVKDLSRLQSHRSFDYISDHYAIDGALGLQYRCRSAISGIGYLKDAEFFASRLPLAGEMLSIQGIFTPRFEPPEELYVSSADFTSSRSSYASPFLGERQQLGKVELTISNLILSLLFTERSLSHWCLGPSACLFSP